MRRRLEARGIVAQASRAARMPPHYRHAAKKEHWHRNASRLILPLSRIFHSHGDHKISIAQSRDLSEKSPRETVSAGRSPAISNGERLRFPRILQRGATTYSAIPRISLASSRDKPIDISKLKRRPVFQKRWPLHYVSARPYREAGDRGEGAARTTR